MSSNPDPFELLKSIVEISTSSFSLEEKIEGIIQTISSGFASDKSLFLTSEEIEKNQFISHLVQERKSLWIDGESSPDGERVLIGEEFISPFFVCIPVYDEESLQGLLYMGFSRKRNFSNEEMDLLRLAAKEIGEIFKNNRLYRASESTISELKALYEMGKAVSSTLKLESLFELILHTGLKILKAKGGVLRIEDKKTGDLKTRFSIGEYHQNPIDEKISKRVFLTRTPLSLNRLGEERAFHSLLCVPFLLKGKVLGTLSLYDKESELSKFDERDLELLLNMTNQVSCAIENAMVHYEISRMAKENERRLKQLSTLWELNKALLMTMNFEHIIHTTLTAITIGEGLGFNRAMLFLVNEKRHHLEGIMGVGPDNAEDAGRIWSYLSQRKGNPVELINQIRSMPKKDSLLNALVREIEIPLDHKQCILSRTVLEGRSFNISSPQAEEGGLRTRCERVCHLSSEVECYVSEHLGQNKKGYSFATIPLWGKGKVIGVILVDNLYNQNPITDEDIQFLNMFSNQAGLAIENARLYRNLEKVHQELKTTQTLLLHREKMAALGELSTNIAHEIRNPLVSIGGFARRLDKTIPEDALEKRYAKTIMKEVKRLEEILDDISIYTRDEPLAIQELNLRDIIEESLSMVGEGLNSEKIKIIKEFPDELPKIRGDYHQLKQVFLHLINNAFEAMKEGGTISVRLKPLLKDGLSFLRAEVEDTGFGIDPENLHHIFNPFYTTKDNRLGLGLSIIHKLITSHSGQIEVDNNPGKGVKFIITLPAFQEKG